jgi:hypothetical protein
MRCANCKGDHNTVADVRACHEHDGKTPAGAVVNTKNDGPMWPPSLKQVAYVLGLQDERQLPESYVVKSQEDVLGMEKDAVSGIINLLKTFARKTGPANATTQWTMPEGRYAIHRGDRGWYFYEVSKPEEGRWKGYTFIKRLIGAPG